MSITVVSRKAILRQDGRTLTYVSEHTGGFCGYSCTDVYYNGHILVNSIKDENDIFITALVRDVIADGAVNKLSNAVIASATLRHPESGKAKTIRYQGTGFYLGADAKVEANLYIDGKEAMHQQTCGDKELCAKFFRNQVIALLKNGYTIIASTGEVPNALPLPPKPAPLPGRKAVTIKSLGL